MAPPDGGAAATPPSARSVVVTGVGRAAQLGEAIAAAFALDGARVAIVARSRAVANERADALRERGLDVHPYACDLADAAAAVAVAREIDADAGGVHALINAAGGFAPSGPVIESDPAVLHAQFSINVATAFAATRAFLPSLRRNRGAVLFFSSAAALPGGRVRELSAYAMAKSGVITLMRAVAQEERGAGTGVRANAIAPGAVRTASNVASMAPGTRFVEPDAVASLAVFLCSPAATHVTGQVIELTP